MIFDHSIPSLYVLMITLDLFSADMHHVYTLFVSLCVLTVVLRFCWCFTIKMQNDTLGITWTSSQRWIVV